MTVVFYVDIGKISSGADISVVLEIRLDETDLRGVKTSFESSRKSVEKTPNAITVESHAGLKPALL